MTRTESPTDVGLSVEDMDEEVAKQDCYITLNEEDGMQVWGGGGAGNRLKWGGGAPPNTPALPLPQRQSHTPTPAPTAFPTASNRRPQAPFTSPVTALQPLRDCLDAPPSPSSRARGGPRCPTPSRGLARPSAPLPQRIGGR